MAQPYQDLQGNWFVAGRPMSAQEVALGQAAQSNMPKQAPQAPSRPSVAPQDSIAAGIAEANRLKQVGLNPLGAGMDFLFGGK